MSWLRRGERPPRPAAAGDDESLPAPVEGAAPGLVALFDGVSEDRSHAVLDLGAASGTKLRVYGRYGTRMRFADLLAAAVSPTGWSGALDALPDRPAEPYDLVLAWDILDRLPPEGRPRLIRRLAAITSPHARLHLVVEASEGTMTHPLRFHLLETGRVLYEVEGPARPARPRLQSGEVERLLEPFRVTRGFTLKVGLREYVATRREGGTAPLDLGL